MRSDPLQRAVTAEELIPNDRVYRGWEVGGHSLQRTRECALWARVQCGMCAHVVCAVSAVSVRRAVEPDVAHRSDHDAVHGIKSKKGASWRLPHVIISCVSCPLFFFHLKL
jgi:hypothetical protein